MKEDQEFMLLFYREQSTILKKKNKQIAEEIMKNTQ